VRFPRHASPPSERDGKRGRERERKDRLRECCGKTDKLEPIRRIRRTLLHVSPNIPHPAHVFVPHAITRRFTSFRSQLCRIAVTNAEVHFRKTRRGHAIKPLCFYLPKPDESLSSGRLKLLGRVKGAKIESLLDRGLGRDRGDRVEGTRRVDRLLAGYHISSHNFTIYVVNRAFILSAL